MCDYIKVKLIKEYNINRIKKFVKIGYHEIPCEPTICSELIMFSTKKELSFDEMVNIITKKRSKYLLYAMSYLYYNYLERFSIFYEESDIGLRKRLYNKTKKYFKRWYSLSLRSDTNLFPQNLLIIEFVRKQMSKIID